MTLGAALAWGCGGADFTSLQGSSGDGGTNDVAAPGADAAARPEDGAAAKDASGARDGTDGSVSTSDAGAGASDGPSAPCPDVRGAYAIVVVQGLGCADLSATAPQCIRQDQQTACGITFRSMSGGNSPAINGSAILGSDGTFADAALTEGSVARSGCTGAWNAATSTMTVDCGGTGSSQSCALALKRTNASCN